MQFRIASRCKKRGVSFSQAKAGRYAPANRKFNGADPWRTPGQTFHRAKTLLLDAGRVLPRAVFATGWPTCSLLAILRGRLRRKVQPQTVASRRPSTYLHYEPVVKIYNLEYECRRPLPRRSTIAVLPQSFNVGLRTRAAKTSGQSILAGVLTR